MTTTARVHCRVGSLEIEKLAGAPPDQVHCRVGSLEISLTAVCGSTFVHCRVGSLEKAACVAQR